MESALDKKLEEEDTTFSAPSQNAHLRGRFFVRQCTQQVLDIGEDSTHNEHLQHNKDRPEVHEQLCRRLKTDCFEEYTRRFRSGQESFDGRSLLRPAHEDKHQLLSADARRSILGAEKLTKTLKTSIRNRDITFFIIAF